MNKEKFLAYSAKRSQTKVETDGIHITRLLFSTTENVTSAELPFAEDEIQKSYVRRKKYVKDVPKNNKKGSSNRTCSVKNMFLKTKQNSQENTCTRVYFSIKLQPWGLQKNTLKNTFFTEHFRTTDFVK